MENKYVGTEFKYALTITSEGFMMGRDDWTATVICGKKKVVCQPDDGAFYSSSEDKWYITFNSAELGAGAYYLVVEIDVPDDDFPDHLRHEVIKLSKPILNIERV